MRLGGRRTIAAGRSRISPPGSSSSMPPPPPPRSARRSAGSCGDYGIAAVSPTPAGLALARRQLDAVSGRYGKLLPVINQRESLAAREGRQMLPRVRALPGAGGEETPVELVLFVGQFDGNEFTMPPRRAGDPPTVVMPIETPKIRYALTQGAPRSLYTWRNAQWLHRCRRDAGASLKGNRPFLTRADPRSARAREIVPGAGADARGPHGGLRESQSGPAVSRSRSGEVARGPRRQKKNPAECGVGLSVACLCGGVSFLLCSRDTVLEWRDPAVVQPMLSSYSASCFLPGRCSALDDVIQATRVPEHP